MDPLTNNLPDDGTESPRQALRDRKQFSYQNTDLMNSTQSQTVNTEADPIMKLLKEVDLNLETSITPSFYYYKRWLWICFPWICLQSDQRYNFSSLIRECYDSNIKYLSVQDDMSLTIRNLLCHTSRLHYNSQKYQRTEAGKHRKFCQGWWSKQRKCAIREYLHNGQQDIRCTSSKLSNEQNEHLRSSKDDEIRGKSD